MTSKKKVRSNTPSTPVPQSHDVKTPDQLRWDFLTQFSNIAGKSNVCTIQCKNALVYQYCPLNYMCRFFHPQSQIDITFRGDF
jgi:hypothetical protein